MKAAVALVLAVAVSLPGVGAAQQSKYLPEGSFALPAQSSAGFVSHPSAIALAPDGNVQVADQDGQIVVFTGQGKFVHSYGKGVLIRPVALLISPAGRAFVVDAKSRRVFVFSAAGEKIGEFGQEGGGLGTFDSPEQLAFGPGGHLFVFDSGRKAVLIFSPDGLFLREVLLPAFLKDPGCLASSPDGSVYICDRKALGRIYQIPDFEQAPESGPLPDNLVHEMPIPASGGGETPTAEIVAAVGHADGAVLVLEGAKGRLWRCGPPSETLKDGFMYGGQGKGPGSFDKPVALSLAGDQLVILDAELRKVERISLLTEAELKPLAAPPLEVRICSSQPSVIPGAIVAVRADSAGPCRFFFLGQKGGLVSRPARSVPYVTAYGDSAIGLRPEEGKGSVLYTQGISSVASVDLGDSLVAVADPGAQRFDVLRIRDGAFLRSVGDNWTDERRFKPGAAAFLPDGRVVVTDPAKGRICFVAIDGTTFSSRLAPMKDPSGVRISPGGEILVWSENGGNGVRIDPKTAATQPLSPPDYPARVGGVAFDRLGNSFVLDAATGRIHVVGPDGLSLIPSFGPATLYKEASGIFTDGLGNLYLPDRGTDQTYVYHWSLFAPAPGAGVVRYTTNGVDLSWKASPGAFTRGYLVREKAAAGTWRVLAKATGLTAHIPTTDARGETPEAVQIVPMTASGSGGEAGPEIPLPGLAALKWLESDRITGAPEKAEAALLQLRDAQAFQAEPAAISAFKLIRLYELDRRGMWDAVLSVGDSLRADVPAGHRVRFQKAMIRAWLGAKKHPAAARELLDLARQEKTSATFRDTSVVRLVFRTYHDQLAVQDTSGGFAFLTGLASLLPDSLATLREAFADTQEATHIRPRFVVPFVLLQQRNYGGLASHLEHVPAGATADTADVRAAVLRHEMEAVALYVTGKKDKAASAFAKATQLRPGISMDAERGHFRRIYGFDLCDSTTAAWFKGIGAPATVPAPGAGQGTTPGSTAPSGTPGSAPGSATGATAPAAGSAAASAAPPASATGTGSATPAAPSISPTMPAANPGAAPATPAPAPPAAPQGAPALPDTAQKPARH